MLSSCDDVIEYSPYQNKVKSKWKKQNIKSYNEILPKASEPFKPFRIGLISDSHTYYDEFERQVKEINKRNDLDFVIHVGDITLSANAREFDWYSEIMNKINIPVFTVIGNHDCLGNGYEVFQEMFGDTNFFFAYKNVKFVFFDDIIWEKKVQDPDFEWFDEALKNDKEYTHVIPFSHIQPWDEQFSYGNEKYFNYLIEENNIPLSVHGHGHKYYYDKKYGKSDYLMVPAPFRDELIILDIQEDKLNVERIEY